MRTIRRTSNLFRGLRLLAIAPLVVRCGGSAPEGQSLYHNAAKAFEPCNKAKIRFMFKKYDLMPALAVCGSNKLSQYRWNPSGKLLYFDLTHTAHLLHANLPDKPLTTLPVPPPIGQPTWLTDDRLALPLPPKTPQAPFRIVLYDTTQRTLETKTLGALSHPSDLHRGDTASEVLFTAVDATGTRGVHRLDLDTGVITRPFPWLASPVNTFTYTPSARALAVGVGTTVTLYNRASQAVLGSWTPANRGVLHPSGATLALEHAGEPQSIFYKRSWETLPGPQQQRELEKAARLEATLPKGYPATLQPPTLSFVDLKTGTRGAMRSFYGSHFQWYASTPTYGSFVLWGFEGVQVNRNIVLGNMAAPLYHIENGKAHPDITIMTAAPSPTTAP